MATNQQVDTLFTVDHEGHSEVGEALHCDTVTNEQQPEAGEVGLCSMPVPKRKTPPSVLLQLAQTI